MGQHTPVGICRQVIVFGVKVESAQGQERIGKGLAQLLPFALVPLPFRQIGAQITLIESDGALQTDNGLAHLAG